MRRLRVVLAAAVLAPLGVLPAAVPSAVPTADAAGPLTCRGVEQTGLWQRLPVRSFGGVEGVATRDEVTSLSLDASRPQELLASNGTTVQLSESNGCAWADALVLTAQPSGAVPLSGLTSTVVTTAQLPGGPSLAAVREGSGAASRPHVVSSPDGSPGSWAETSAGLPAQGAPRLLEAASDGATAYLALSPTASSGPTGGLLPEVPGASSPAGLLYATTDGGRSWQLRTSGAALAVPLDALSVDVGDPERLYAVSGGALVVSGDGGRSFSTPEGAGSGVTAVEAMEAGEVAVLTGGGQLLHSTDGGTTFTGRPAPPGAAGAAYRRGDGRLVVEAAGALLSVDARGRGGFRALDAGVPATAGSLLGDRGADATFHARSGRLVLRYVDPLPPEATPPPPPGDLSVPPPPIGSVQPAARAVRLPVGSSTELEFVLQQPRSPTPLDLYLLVDRTESMGRLLGKLREQLGAALAELGSSGLDLKVGLGSFAAGPAEGEPDYPPVDPGNVRYDGPPDLYARLLPVGDPGPALQAAVAGLETQPPPSGRTANTVEGGLFALRDLVRGEGLRRQGSTGAVPSFVVPPGQEAGFRGQADVRRVVAYVSDQQFTDAYGTPKRPDGTLDREGVAAELAAAGIRFLGLEAESTSRARADMQLMARLTGSLVPEGGLDCGEGRRLPAGAPLVCDSSQDFGGVLTRLAEALVDRQSIALVPRAGTPVLSGLEGSRLRDLDVTVANTAPFTVRVSCLDVVPGAYRQQVDAVLRGTVVGTATVDVTCLPLAAAVAAPAPPQAAAPAEPVPPAQPAAQAPAPPAPAPPVVQPQVQPQTQVQSQVQAQVNPMTAGALQQQQELALALALLADEQPSPGSELAMVDRGRAQQLRALALLAAAAAATSGVGLARLRARPATSPARVRRR